MARETLFLDLDPDLLRRYNYGRGTGEQPLQDSDRSRVEKAQIWLSGLTQRGFPPSRLQALWQALPFVGPYAAFAGYVEALLALLIGGHTGST